MSALGREALRAALEAVYHESRYEAGVDFHEPTSGYKDCVRFAADAMYSKAVETLVAPALPAGLPDVERPLTRERLGPPHLTDATIDAMAAALRKTFWIYYDEEAGVDADDDAVSVLDALVDGGFVLAALEGSATLPSDPPDVFDDDFRDRHERAMRDHIIGGMDVEHECDDLCSDAILDRLAGRTPSNEYPLRATLPSDRGRTE